MNPYVGVLVCRLMGWLDSLLVGRLVSRSVMLSLKRSKLDFHAPIRALVYLCIIIYFLQLGIVECLAFISVMIHCNDWFLRIIILIGFYNEPSIFISKS